MCIIIVQMYKKALTHEHPPSGEIADEVKGEGVVSFNASEIMSFTITLFN